ncbi:MAG: hypothetical protein MZV63_17260 [Marinilabiliales bacterium]|nr:hypothetical protein [Marinilabiliales bacterium]
MRESVSGKIRKHYRQIPYRDNPTEDQEGSSQGKELWQIDHVYQRTSPAMQVRKIISRDLFFLFKAPRRTFGCERKKAFKNLSFLVKNWDFI